MHGRTSFAFWKCQMKPKIRACVKDFFSFSRDLTKHISSIPTRLFVCIPVSTMVCSTTVPSRGAGCAQAAHPSGHCIHPTASIHLHQAVGSGRWISRAECEAQNPLLTHRSQRLFTLQILCFLPRPEHLEEGRAEHSGSCLF